MLPPTWRCRSLRLSERLRSGVASILFQRPDYDQENHRPNDGVDDCRDDATDDDMLSFGVEAQECLAAPHVDSDDSGLAQGLSASTATEQCFRGMRRGDVGEALTPTEFRLLGRLVSAPGEAVRRRALLAAGWPYGEIVSENTLDSYVRRLRVKLTRLGSAGRLVTVRAVGYRWD